MLGKLGPHRESRPAPPLVCCAGVREERIISEFNEVYWCCRMKEWEDVVLVELTSAKTVRAQKSRRARSAKGGSAIGCPGLWKVSVCLVHLPDTLVGVTALQPLVSDARWHRSRTSTECALGRHWSSGRLLFRRQTRRSASFEHTE